MSCLLFPSEADSVTLVEEPIMSSVLKKRRKKMRKHKYKKLRKKQKFLRRKG